MPIVFIILILFSIFMFGLIHWDKCKCKSTAVATGMIFAIILTWLMFSLLQTCNVCVTYEVRAQRVGNIAAISYVDYDGNVKLVNITKELQRNIDPGTLVKVKILKRMYKGITYWDLNDKYEIVEEKK